MSRTHSLPAVIALFLLFVQTALHAQVAPTGVFPIGEQEPRLRFGAHGGVSLSAHDDVPASELGFEPRSITVDAAGVGYHAGIDLTYTLPTSPLSLQGSLEFISLSASGTSPSYVSSYRVFTDGTTWRYGRFTSSVDVELQYLSLSAMLRATALRTRRSDLMLVIGPTVGTLVWSSYRQIARLDDSIPGRPENPYSLPVENDARQFILFDDTVIGAEDLRVGVMGGLRWELYLGGATRREARTVLAFGLLADIAFTPVDEYSDWRVRVVHVDAGVMF